MDNIKVVKVIDEKTLVINKGSKDGIKNGFEFLVYYLDENDIIDPVTGENLGKIEYVVGRGTTAHIQEKLTTIICIDKEKRNIKKIVKKSSQLLWEIGNTREEITEPEIIELGFKGAKIGDMVKIINNK